MPRSPFPPGPKSDLPEVTDKTFTETLKKHKLAVVSVRADWCGYCPAIAPTVDAIAKKHAGTVGVFRMDLDANEQMARKLKVKAVPTVLFFRSGKLIGSTVGANPEAVLGQLKKLLKG
jgi:thioredoxin